MAFPKSGAAVGHVRYSTTGANTMQNVQPFVTEFLTGALRRCTTAMWTNAGEMREKLEPFGLDFFRDERQRGDFFADRRIKR